MALMTVNDDKNKMADEIRRLREMVSKLVDDKQALIAGYEALLSENEELKRELNRN